MEIAWLTRQDIQQVYDKNQLRETDLETLSKGKAYLWRCLDLLYPEQVEPGTDSKVIMPLFPWHYITKRELELLQADVMKNASVAESGFPQLPGSHYFRDGRNEKKELSS